MNDDALTKAECALRTVARRVTATAEVLNLSRSMSEPARVLSAWAEVPEHQAAELQEIADCLSEKTERKTEWIASNRANSEQ